MVSDLDDRDYVPVTDEDWAWMGERARAEAIAKAKAAHPAGKALEDLPTLDDVLTEFAWGTPLQQPGVADLLSRITAPPLPHFEEAASEVYFEALDLLMEKQAAYGPKAISASPGGAINGINVRMHDKLSRVVHLLSTGAQQNDESLRDTYMDLANYALIAVMVLDGTWPE